MHGYIGTGPVNSFTKVTDAPCDHALVPVQFIVLFTIQNVCKSTGGRADADDYAKVGPSSYKL